MFHLLCEGNRMRSGWLKKDQPEEKSCSCEEKRVRNSDKFSIFLNAREPEGIDEVRQKN